MTTKTRKPKAPKAPETYEDFRVHEWGSFQRDIRDQLAQVNPPNYDFKVGEKVRIGNLVDCTVEEVLMDGKVIHISRSDVGQEYGKPFDNNRRLPLYRWWHDVEPLVTEEDTNFGRESLQTSYLSTSLDSLVHMAYHRGFITSPDYQRDYVWSLEDKQRLIHSIMDRTDIGKFVFLERDEDYRLEVIDGKQRMNAIIEFMEGRFTFKGKTWFQFSRGDKHSFTDLGVQYAKLQASRVKRSDVLWLFLSVNVGGVPQTEEHIAKARKLYEEALVEAMAHDVLENTKC